MHCNSATSFDRFTIEMTGKVYNGKTEVWDESGGWAGRTEKRLDVMEAAIRVHTKMLTGMAAMMLLMAGLDKAENIANFFDKLKVLLH